MSDRFPFRSISKGVWIEDIPDTQFQISIIEGRGIAMKDLQQELYMTGGEVELLDRSGQRIASLVFKKNGLSDLPSTSLPEYFVLRPTSDLRTDFWTIGLDFNRKGEGCWVSEEGCDCPRYHDCIQFDPPYGCANCDENFSQFFSQADWLGHLNNESEKL